MHVCALIVIETSALYKSFTYLLTYLLTYIEDNCIGLSQLLRVLLMVYDIVACVSIYAVPA